MGKFQLIFKRATDTATGKFACPVFKGAECIGIVLWDKVLRRYVFVPATHKPRLDVDCLTQITNFIGELVDSGSNERQTAG